MSCVSFFSIPSSDSHIKASKLFLDAGFQNRSNGALVFLNVDPKLIQEFLCVWSFDQALGSHFDLVPEQKCYIENLLINFQFLVVVQSHCTILRLQFYLRAPDFDLESGALYLDFVIPENERDNLESVL